MVDQPSRGYLPLVSAVAVLIAVAAAVLAALTAGQMSDAEKQSSVRDGALAAGRQIAVDFAAYDYRHIAADFKRVADESTGKFHSDYLTQTTGLHDLIVKAKAVSTAEVASAGVVGATADRATVVVALNRTIRNSSSENPTADSFGVQILLVHQDGRWLASELTPV